MAGAFLEVTHVGDWFPSYVCFFWKVQPIIWKTSFSFVYWVTCPLFDQKLLSYLLFSTIVIFLLAILFCHDSVDYFLGVSFIHYIYYHSYLAVLYSYRNTCNSYSYCEHAICSTHSSHARTCLHWVGLTCAQPSLKRSPNKASSNSLTSE